MVVNLLNKYILYMENTIDKYKQIWSSESGYRRINNFFSPKGTYQQGLFIKGDKNIIEYDGIDYDVKDVIAGLKQGMKPSKTNETYYRGDNLNSKQSFQKEGFTSVSQDIDDAIAFMENKQCCLFEVTIDADVLRLETGVEKEILIENGCFWEYTGKKKDDKFLVNIHSPRNKNYNFPTYAVAIQNSKPTIIPPTIQHPAMQEMTDEEFAELNYDSDSGGMKKKQKSNKKHKKQKRKTIKKRKRKTKKQIYSWFIGRK
jgi:hypothetical protein